MVDFKPSLGYLALANKVDVLPMYLDGTHDALPKGELLPQRDSATSRRTSGRSSPTTSSSARPRACRKADAYREASRLVELAVRKLAPAGSVNRGPAAPPSTGKLTAESVMAPETES